MLTYDFIIWDWNGTLLDDISASLNSVNDMLALRGMEPIGVERYRECIGTPIRCFYEQVFDMDKEDYPALLAEYHAGYDRHLSGCSVGKGAIEALEFFASQGSAQVIISSCEQNQLLKGVESCGLSGYFDAVLGASDFLAAEKVERAQKYLAEKSQKSSPKILVIGDLLHDFELANAVSAHCVITKSGHEDWGRLEKSGVDTVNNLTELVGFITKKQQKQG